MKKFILGIMFWYVFTNGLNGYYEYRFHEHFVNECGVKNGYSGANQKRFDCVYDHMRILKPIADFTLSGIHYDYKDGGYQFVWYY